MMRQLVVLVIIILLLLQTSSAYSQQQKYRSDSLSLSLMFRFFLITYGGGIEVPFKQSSIGAQVGINYISNGEYDVDKVFAVALEYKRHIRTTRRSPYYYGGYILYRETDHGSPEEDGRDRDWFKSTSRCVGILGGIKIYTNPRVYFDLFTGLHGGMREGTVRSKDYLSTGEVLTFDEEKKQPVFGLRLGLTLGFHLFRKPKTKPE